MVQSSSKKFLLEQNLYLKLTGGFATDITDNFVEMN